MINIRHHIMTLVIDIVVIIQIHIIFMEQHRSKFLNFNIHLIHFYKKMGLLNKFILDINKNVLIIKKITLLRSLEDFIQ